MYLTRGNLGEGELSASILFSVWQDNIHLFRDIINNPFFFLCILLPLQCASHFPHTDAMSRITQFQLSCVVKMLLGWRILALTFMRILDRLEMMISMTPLRFKTAYPNTDHRRYSITYYIPCTSLRCSVEVNVTLLLRVSSQRRLLSLARQRRASAI